MQIEVIQKCINKKMKWVVLVNGTSTKTFGILSDAYQFMDSLHK